MEIKFGKKKLVIFWAKVNEEPDIIDELIKQINEKNPSWTKKECREAAELMKQFIDLIIKSIQKVMSGSETTEFQQEFNQLKTKFKAFAERKGVKLEIQ